MSAERRADAASDASERLIALLAAGDALGVARLATAPGAPTGALFATAMHAHDLTFGGRKTAPLGPLAKGWATTAERWNAAQVAVFCAAPVAEVRRLRFAAIPADRSLIPPVLRMMAPDRRAALGEVLMALGGDGWHAVRALVRSGDLPKPTSEAYILGLYMSHRRSVAEWLADDPALLEDEVWRVFEVEGGGELSLAAFDKYTAGTRGWQAALVDLAARGVLDRDRLLDASLAALARDFAQFRAGWYSRFHIALAPSDDERAARVDRYLALVGSRIPPTVSFALAMLAPLVSARGVHLDRLVTGLAPALHAAAKGTVTAALALLEAAATGRAPAVARLAAVALGHATAEVQRAALGVIERHGDATDPALRAAVALRRDLVAASLRARLGPWLDPVAPAPEAAPAPVSGEAADAAPRGPAALTPIGDLAELVDRWLAVLEDDGDPMAIEAVLDGLARLGQSAPEEKARRLGPLLARSRRLLARPTTRPLTTHLARLALAFGGAEPDAAPEQRDLTELFGARVDRLAARVRAGRSGPLLSAPTHAGGFVDPEVLVGRVKAGPLDPDDVLDAALALLRLAPWGREAARKAATRLRGEVAQALRHALGAEVAVGPTAALWIAAARARHPGADDPAVLARHPGHGPDAAEVARPTWSLTPFAGTWDQLVIATEPPRPAGPAPLEHVAPALVTGSRFERAGHDAGALRWALSLRPGASEALFGEGAAVLYFDLYSSEPFRWAHVYLEPLLEPWTPIGPLAAALLAVGLAAKASAVELMAIDALARAVADGRFEPARDALGDAIARALVAQRAVAGRWARTLGEVARRGPGHSAAVSALITRALRGAVARAPKDIGALLELLDELVVARAEAVTDPEARAWLEALAAARGGKGRALARSLLARP